MRIHTNGNAARLGVTLVVPALFALGAAAQNASRDAGPSLDEVIQKSIEARGGADKIKAIQNVKLTGKMLLMGGQVEAPCVIIVKRPAFMRTSLDIQGQALVRAFDGATGWTINPFMGSGEAQKLSDDETRDMQDGIDLDGPLVDYKAKGHTVELAGKEDVQGALAYKLKINKKSGKIDYAYLDTKTFLPVKTVTKATVQGSQAEIESYPSNYKPVNGVMSPFSVEQKIGGQTMMQMTIDKMEPNVEIDDTIFKMPAKK